MCWSYPWTHSSSFYSLKSLKVLLYQSLGIVVPYCICSVFDAERRHSPHRLTLNVWHPLSSSVMDDSNISSLDLDAEATEEIGGISCHCTSHSNC